jgi:hypothetical protein
MQPTPVYTTIAHADVTENGRVWRYSVVIRYTPECEHREFRNDLFLYHHPTDEELRPVDYHPSTDAVRIFGRDGQATAQDVAPEHWEDMFYTAENTVWPEWPTFSDVGTYPQRARLIVRLLQEAGVP